MACKFSYRDESNNYEGNMLSSSFNENYYILFVIRYIKCILYLLELHLFLQRLINLPPANQIIDKQRIKQVEVHPHTHSIYT